MAQVSAPEYRVTSEQVPMSWQELEAPQAQTLADIELARSFVHVFAGTAEGEKVLARLRAMTIDREVPPTATDAELRHHEGGRYIVRYILRQIEQGQK